MNIHPTNNPSRSPSHAAYSAPDKDEITIVSGSNYTILLKNLVSPKRKKTKFKLQGNSD